MRKLIFPENKHFKDLNPMALGYENCPKSKKCDSFPRPYTLIHFVESGKGILYKNGNAYHVKAAECFIINANEEAMYIADSDDPWSYRWIGFDGELSQKFTELPPVFKASPEIFYEMTNTEHSPWSREYLLAALLFKLYADLFATDIQSNSYVRQIKEYIDFNYSKDIKVEDIAKMLNFDRKYLSRIFKKKTGTTIQQYLISRRLYVAKWKIEIGVSINETAFSCGFNSITNFSKMFKQHYGMSPGKWRKRINEGTRES